LVAVLLTQAADGVLTYVGLTTVGSWMEGNPLLATLIGAFGRGTALTAAKIFAGSLGVILHVTGVHRVVAILTGLYLAAAIGPWTAILFF
jgi:hypothetical protein